MSNDPLHGQIKDLLTKNGAMGVNQLQKEIGIPLSTLQKYLDKQQNYFKKNHARKWVLPEVAVESEMSAMAENYVSIVESQLASISVLIETVMSQFKSTLTIMDANKPQTHPVAGKSANIHPRLLNLDENTTLMVAAVKQHKKNIPEEYVDLLLNVNWLDLAIDMGAIYYKEVLGSELTDVLTGSRDTISDEILITLEKYQNGTNQA